MSRPLHNPLFCSILVNGWGTLLLNCNWGRVLISALILYFFIGPRYDLPDLPQLNRTTKTFNKAGRAGFTLQADGQDRPMAGEKPWDMAQSSQIRISAKLKVLPGVPATLRRFALKPLNRIFVPELLEFRVTSNYYCI